MERHVNWQTESPLIVNRQTNIKSGTNEKTNYRLLDTDRAE